MQRAPLDINDPNVMSDTDVALYGVLPVTREEAGDDADED